MSPTLKHKSMDIRMLPRDWELLEYVETQGFATLSQLRKRFFNRKANCSMRLKKLLAFKYLEKKPLFDFFITEAKRGIGQTYFPHILNLNISPKQQVYFINRDYSKGFGKSKKLFKPSMVLHQLILNELRNYLDQEIVHKMMLNDPKLQIASSIQIGRNPEIVPDLSYEYESIKIAIELERTVKGMVRYFHRFNFFRDSIYSHVIYYYTDEAQLKPLLKRAGSSRKFAFAHYKAPNELYSNVYGPLRLNDFIHKLITH